MRTTRAVTAALLFSLVARSVPLTAQAPTLEPRLAFEVASVKVITQQA